MSLRSHTIRVRGTPSELARVRREVAAWAEAAGLDESPARRLQLDRRCEQRLGLQPVLVHSSSSRSSFFSQARAVFHSVSTRFVESPRFSAICR